VKKRGYRAAGREKSVPGGRQRVRSVLTAEGQQGSTDEGDQGDDCTEAGCAVMISSSLVRKL